MSSYIRPYKHEGLWVFDDLAVGLAREPFIAGADKTIDLMVEQIPEADKGFHLVFSATPFPGYQWRLQRQREEYGGNWYLCSDFGIEGWLCPALFKYFAEAPQDLYVQARPLG